MAVMDQGGRAVRRWALVFGLLLAAGCGAEEGGEVELIECRLNSDCGVGQLCVEGACVDGDDCEGDDCLCRSDADCGPGTSCDTRTGRCAAIGCEEDNDCALGKVCRQSTCVTDVDADRDRDGVPDAEDSCPELPNPDQDDLDDDGQGDACDDDDDDDGVADADDNCPTLGNPDQSDEDDNGLGDACDNDRDGDGVIDEDDNCPEVANDDQLDLDEDGVGDACDEDDDGDNDPDVTDCAPRDRNINATAQEVCNNLDDNCNGLIDDGDGIDGCALHWPDVDEDGEGDLQATARCLCGPVDVFTALSGTDCDDSNPDVGRNKPEICNDIDDNCVGGIDENFPAKGQACDTDVDADLCADGVQVCAEGGLGLVCNDTAQTDAAEEICNGLDDDCDGRVDEGFDLGQGCRVPGLQGVCRNGLTGCGDNGEVTCRQTIFRQSEICNNGPDDDCDGRDDTEDFDLGGNCTITNDPNVFGECRNGEWECGDDGDRACGQILFRNQDNEICDGKDNDCDGTTDLDAPWPTDSHEGRNDENSYVLGVRNTAPGFPVDNNGLGPFEVPAGKFQSATDLDSFDYESAPFVRDYFLCRVTGLESSQQVQLQATVTAMGATIPYASGSIDNVRNGAVLRVRLNTPRPSPTYGVYVAIRARSGVVPCKSSYRLECKFSDSQNF